MIGYNGSGSPFQSCASLITSEETEPREGRVVEAYCIQFLVHTQLSAVHPSSRFLPYLIQDQAKVMQEL